MRGCRFNLCAGLALFFVAIVAFDGASLENDSASFSVEASYDIEEHMIPMRDGVKLHTWVISPKDASGSYPMIMARTPYGARRALPNDARKIYFPSETYYREGYIFVFQDLRGTSGSEGEFVMLRPLIPDKRGPNEVDESSDAYDTIEWLVNNIPNNNGNVGMLGGSYGGWTTAMAMIDAHPALKAASPQGSPSDMFIGDDFHHNGAFRLMYAFSWISGMFYAESPAAAGNGRFDYGTPWGYDFFLDVGPVKNINERYFHETIPEWNLFAEHPVYDDYWKGHDPGRSFDDVNPAVLNVAGWFDAEDFYGPLSIYRSIEKKDPDNKSILVVGPWMHTGWNAQPAMGMTGETLGDINFGSDTAQYFQEDVMLPFFRFHLKGEGGWEPSEAIVFETGNNEWQRHDQWPPANTTPRGLYFHPDGKLSFETPKTDGADSYISDPAKPVPFTADITTSQGHLWMVEDQRFAATRPDVLVYESDVLEEDVTIAGPILANLFFSTTGTDADYVVKLIDVFPSDAKNDSPRGREVQMGDYQMLLAGEVFRAKFRNSYEAPEPLTPGEITPLRFDLRDRYHTFKAGHRIMVQVQSSWFPVIDRNPQTFVNIYEADEDDFQVATQTIYRSPEHPSHIELNVLQ